MLGSDRQVKNNDERTSFRLKNVNVSIIFKKNKSKPKYRVYRDINRYKRVMKSMSMLEIPGSLLEKIARV